MKTLRIASFLPATEVRMYLSDRSYSGGYSGGRRSGGGYGDRNRPRRFRHSPVKVGEQYDVTIEAISNRGDSGVAKIEGFVIFVPGTKVDEKIKVKITKVGNGYATAELAQQTQQANDQTASENPEQTQEDTNEGEEIEGEEIEGEEKT
ncbi:MAG TPA: TRAM domain-containing protein [Nitrososphaeraceae archaeon]|jgi:predicted RNA-binding protein with TRAM domain|nr:TRAM domain-containing protein [Nitrososphaeraceae archaeon]